MNITNLELANAVRMLSVDAVEKAKSGHPGLPLGMADVATILFSKFLKFDPTNPAWPNRDRFVLSAGHGSMLLYALLHLTGYEDMTIDEIKRFRQLGSKTPGHPEYGITSGVETTTGPLGQGLSNAVGMAMAERMLNARYGNMFDHRTYVLVGDGDLMEGISQEAISLAGHFNLNRLIVLWDNNSISIDGPTSLTVSDNYKMRFEASGWNFLEINGHDFNEIGFALLNARSSDKPICISCKTIIGYGAPTKAGTSKCHGAPLGSEEVEGLRDKLGWKYLPFEIPENILAEWRKIGQQHVGTRKQWEEKFAELPVETKGEILRIFNKTLSASWQKRLLDLKKTWSEEQPKMATRKASGEVLEILNDVVPELIGGSADLSESVFTKTKGLEALNKDNWNGRYIYWGVREHAMAGALNGMALHGGFIPYTGTFLAFVDYMRPSIRLASLMKQQVIYVLTHDSIGVGEDGPTHQPTEILSSLRTLPNLRVYRPADAVETLECWEVALLDKEHPSALVLARQAVPAVRTKYDPVNHSARGAYVLREASDKRAVAIYATGSEVILALKAREILEEKGIPTAVVSMPCWELFDLQHEFYQHSVLGDGSIKIAVEAANCPTWDKYIGSSGVFIGLNSFGVSAPCEELYQYFGITVDAIVKAAEQKLEEKTQHLQQFARLVYANRR